MPIPLSDFESYIDETILQRGLDYFENGYVNTPAEISPGIYEAKVEGTDDYTVTLRLDYETIKEYACDCPYDLGPVCKHVVAVIYYFLEEALDPTEITGSKKKKAKKPKKQTVAEQVDELLHQLSHDELKQFLKEHAHHDASFRKMLLSSFAYRNKNESKTIYSEQVNAILRKASANMGFIDWQDSRVVGNEVHKMLITAQKHAANKNYQTAIWMAAAVMEEMTEALQYADDSGGDIGGNIYEAYDLLVDMASRKLPEKIRQQLLDYTLKAFQENIYADWDWHMGMLELASMLISNEEEAKETIGLLDQIKDSEYKHEEEQAQAIKFRILQRTKGEKEAERFMEQHLSNPALRTAAIKKAISTKDFEKAIAMAQDGIKHDSTERPGLAYDWYNWLLNIALEQKDTQKTIEYARLLFIEANREKQPYYDLLKKHVHRDKWPVFVEQLVSDIQKQNSWLGFDLIAQIYVNEQSWEKLLALLNQEISKGSVSLKYVKQYEKHLAKDYANELSDLYQQGIIQLLERNTGRSHYRNACRYIRRMIKLKSIIKANRLIERLKATYPQRRALLEELESV